MTASRSVHDGNLLRASGRVRARIGPLLLEGDEGTLNSDTGEVEVRGHARITLPERSDRTVVRYGAGTIVTEQALGVSADRIAIKYGLLRGRGHVDVRTDKGRLQADEIDLFLRIGDADMRGNVRLNGGIPATPVRTFREWRNPFPPDIVK
jgi:lipopolysaccharide assembly outer membrane protein LptD (OstA)